MSSQMSQAIKQLVQDKGISEELVFKTIEEALLAAYKRKYGNSDNAVVKFSEEGTDVTIYSQKKIVDEVYDPVTEIALEDALDYDEGCEIGDELLIEVNPAEFDRIAVQSAKQKARQTLREIQKDTLYSEFKDKVGEMVIGYYQRERNGTIYVDLGKTEGILPKRFQSPREIYHANDRIKALIYEVNKTPSGLQIVLSRTHTEFVKRIFELEVPEIYDRTVEIFKIVREPGYRTKIAVYSNRDDVDPVGACVGVKGVRIQAIVRELEGEKIDIVKYDPDPRVFIRNSLSPAEVNQVVLLDEGKKHALAVVSDNQFSLAIGKQGLNVRLANRLVDWNIDVKNQQQFQEMDLSAETKRAVSALFGDVEDEREIVTVAELPGLSERQIQLLRSAGIEMIEDLVALGESQISGIAGLSAADAAAIRKAIEENVEVVDEDEAAGDEIAEDDGADASDAEAAETEAAETEAAETTEVEVVEEEISSITELPGITPELIAVLRANKIERVEDLVELDEAELAKLKGMTAEQARAVRQLIEESVEVVEEEDEEASSDEE
jgi:transcription termination/antitermination protein NusA